MKAKKFLNQIREIEEEIKDKLEKLGYINDRLTNITVAMKGEEVVSGSRNTNKNEEMIIEKIMLEDEIKKDHERRRELMYEIMEVINQLDNIKMEQLLQCRYFFFMSWEDISDMLHISLRHCHRLHKKSLQNIEKILK